MRACSLPRCPTPMTAIRSRVMIASSSGLGARSGNLLGQLPHQLDVQRMTGAIRDDVAVDIVPEERQIADQIQHLVPGRLVRIAQSVLDWSVLAEDQQVGHARVDAETLSAQLEGFVLQKKRAARRDLVGARFRRGRLGMYLTVNGRVQAVI